MKIDFALVIQKRRKPTIKYTMNVNLTQPIFYLLLLFGLSACKDETEISPEKLPQDTQGLESLLNKDIDTDTRLAVYYQLYKNHRATDMEQAAHYANQQRSLAEQLDNTLYLGRAYHALGTLQEQAGGYIEAVNAYLHAIDAFEKIEYSAGVATDFNYMGLVFMRAEGYKDAIPYFEKSAHIYKESRDFKNQSIAYTNLAICNSKTQRYTEAKENIKLAIALQLQFDSNDINRLAHVYNEAGNIFYYASQYDQAIEYYNKALTFNPSYEQMQVILYDNLANTYLAKGKYDKATKFLLKGKGINIDTKTTVERYNIEGTLYQLQGNHQKAAEVFEKAITIANKDIINEPLGKTLNLLSQSYRTLTANGAKVAYNDIYLIADLKEQQQVLKDSFYNGMNAKALQAALNKEIEAHNNRKLQASMEARQWVIFRYGAAIVAGLLVLLWVVTNQKRKWALASREWQTKSESLKYKCNDLEFENEDLKAKGLRLTKIRKEFREIFHQITEAVSENEKGKEELKKYDHLFEDDDNQPPKH